MLFVARIHNNSLGTCIKVRSYNDRLKLIEEMFQDQMGRQLTYEERDYLEDLGELHDYSDSDNQFSWSIGVMEEG